MPTSSPLFSLPPPAGLYHRFPPHHHQHLPSPSNLPLMLSFPQISRKENIDLLPALLAATPVGLHCHLPPHQHRHPPSPSNLPQVLSFPCISKKVNTDLLPTLLAATFSQSVSLPSSSSSSALAFPLQSSFSASLPTDLQTREYRPPLCSPRRHLPLISAVTFPHHHQHRPSPSNVPQVLSFLWISEKENADLLHAHLAVTSCRSPPSPSSPSSLASAFPSNLPIMLFFAQIFKKENIDLLPALLTTTFHQSSLLPSSLSSPASAFPSDLFLVLSFP